MGLREFRDSTGVVWRVWDVTPEVLDKRTTAEDFMQDWQDGWLCFETEGARRRLATYPTVWETMPESELEELLVKAQPVKQRGASTGQGAAFRPAAPTGGEQAAPPSGRPDEGRLTPTSNEATSRARTFKDQSTGRTFVAALFRLPPSRSQREGDRVASSPGTVLRFLSGMLVLDLERWPEDWERYSDSQLVELMRRAQPADPSSISGSTPLGRRSDPGN
jgi:hypothetical protein